jgi:hypothetical protein
MRCATKVMQEVVYVLVPYKKVGSAFFFGNGSTTKEPSLFLKVGLFEVRLFVFLMSCTPNKAMKK